MQQPSFELVPDEEIVYQYYLDGFDKQWTEWTKYSFKEYTNLPSGKYNFRVRYTDQQSSAGELSVLNFKVLPRWYLSRIAIISYFLLAVLIIWFSYATLRLRFARTQHMLEQIINKRTEDLIIEKTRLRICLQMFFRGTLQVKLWKQEGNENEI